MLTWVIRTRVLVCWSDVQFMSFLVSFWVTGCTGQPNRGTMWKSNELHVWQHITTSVTSQSSILCVTVHLVPVTSILWRDGVRSDQNTSFGLWFVSDVKITPSRSWKIVVCSIFIVMLTVRVRAPARIRPVTNQSSGFKELNAVWVRVGTIFPPLRDGVDDDACFYVRTSPI